MTDSVNFSSDTDEDISFYQCSLLAMWNVTGTGTAPYRYDWSVGIKGEPPGTGLIDRINEPIWRDAGSETRAIKTSGLIAYLSYKGHYFSA